MVPQPDGAAGVDGQPDGAAEVGSVSLLRADGAVRVDGQCAVRVTGLQQQRLHLSSGPG